MWINTVEAIAQIASALIAGGGLLAVVLQLRHLGQDLRGNARASIYAVGNHLKEVFVEYPHLRMYFLNNKSIEPGHPDYDRVAAIADLYCLYLEQIGTQSRNISPANRIAWLRYVADIYNSSPIIRNHLEHRMHWYSAELQHAVHVSRTGDYSEQTTEDRPSASTPPPDSATRQSATRKNKST